MDQFIINTEFTHYQIQGNGNHKVGDDTVHTINDEEVSISFSSNDKTIELILLGKDGIIKDISTFQPGRVGFELEDLKQLCTTLKLKEPKESKGIYYSKSPAVSGACYLSYKQIEGRDYVCVYSIGGGQELNRYTVLGVWEVEMGEDFLSKYFRRNS